MENNQIVSRMNTYLHTSAKLLEEWLGKLLPKTSDDWWEECVIEKLSYNQRGIAKSKGFTKLGDFDLAVLLRIADKSWYAMRNVAYLPTKERECIRDMVRVCNNWAHCSAVLPGKDTVIADLTTLHQFFEQMESDDKLISEVDFLEDIENLSDAEIGSMNPVEVAFDNETIWFTQTHIAEIRELRALQEAADKYKDGVGNGQKKPVDKPVREDDDSEAEVVVSGTDIYKDYIGKRVYHKGKRAHAIVKTCGGKYLGLEFENNPGKVSNFDLEMCLSKGWIEIV